MSSQLDKVLNAYRTIAQIPSITNAKIYKNGSVIVSNWNERNIERNSMSKIELTHLLDEKQNVVSNSFFGTDITTELMSVISPSENFKAILRESTDSKNTKKQYLEIWKQRYMKQCMDLSALEIHGDVYADSEFGSFCWNLEENSLIYIAERKLKKSEPFYKRKVVKAKESSDKEEPAPSKGEEYDFKPEWGEQLVGKHLSSIIICKLESELFDVVDWLPESWCPGQVMWSPDGTSIIGVAWETEPRRLGLIFCTNRPSFIFSTTPDDKTFKIISTKGKSVRSPRFSENGKYLIWLQRDEGGPHHGCHELVKTTWPIEENPIIKTVIDTVHKEVNIENNETFTGIYSAGLPKRCFSIDEKRVIFSTPQKFEIRSYIVDIETGKMYDISDKSMPCSTVVLDVHQDIILATRSSYKIPSQLIVAKLPKIGEENLIKWNLIEENSIALPDVITNSDFDYMNLQHANVPDSINDFTALYFGKSKSSDEKLPLIVYPHGGPHSGCVNSFGLATAFFRLLGFSWIMVNYRGSTGAGQNSVLYLPGKIGEADVKDCILATDETIKKHNSDAENCVLFGGSHGGFLVTHLSGQYADKYRSVVALNPVTDVATMTNPTDIPDWCSYEAGVEYNEMGPIDEELLIKMRKSSPLIHAHNVKAPTLLCLGSKDKRVPYYQGIEFYHKIKANGCKARMLIYEDNHSLSSGMVETDFLINSAMWFLEHLKS